MYAGVVDVTEIYVGLLHAELGFNRSEIGHSMHSTLLHTDKTKMTAGQHRQYTYLHNTPLSSSGGLVWHVRAWRNRQRWHHFRQTVHCWLQEWQPPSTTLVLVGPSAGYTLSQDWLNRFERIVVMEPDPIARWLLCRRFKSAPLLFDRLDVLGGKHHEEPEHLRTGLNALTNAYPDAAILFCNILGQVSPQDERAHAWCGAVKEVLQNNHWASYHDLISTARKPVQDTPYRTDHSESLEPILTHFWQGGEIELVDHCTLPLHGDGPSQFAVWPMTACQHHLVGWTHHAPM